MCVSGDVGGVCVCVLLYMLLHCDIACHCVELSIIPPHAATAGSGSKSPTPGPSPPAPGLLSLRAALSSAFAACLAPPYEATATAHATACLKNAVCVQLAHVLAWLSNRAAPISWSGALSPLWLMLQMKSLCSSLLPHLHHPPCCDSTIGWKRSPAKAHGPLYPG